MENLGQCVGCAQWLMRGWPLEIDSLSFFFFLSSLFHLLNPTGSGEKPTPDIIRWIWKRTKASTRFFSLAEEEKAGK